MKAITNRYEYIHQPITVKGVFDSKMLKLESFIWNNHIYKVKEHCLISKASKGITPIWLYSVMTDDGSYKLRLDTDTLNWWLEEVYTSINV